MKRGGVGGGNTITGLIYEAKVDLGTFLSQQQDYKVSGFDVFYKEKLVAKLFKKHGLYKYLASVGVDWQKHISSKLLPDNCIYVIVNNTIYILDNWFKADKYKDVRDYIISVGCHYYYNYIPLQELGLPVPPTNKK